MIRPPHPAVAAAVPASLAMATFPGRLPSGAATIGVLCALALMLTVTAARRLTRGREPSPWSGRSAAISALVSVLVLFVAARTQDAMRTRIGMPPLQIGDLLTVVGAAAVVLLLGVATRSAWQRRGRWWPAATAVVTAVALVISAPPAANAAGAPAEIQMLEQASPVGAVRSYTTLADAPDPRQRARLAATRLVDAGGLSRRHLVIVIPTGSGWVNPHLVDGLEQRFGARVATVSMQYDDRPSWMAYTFGRRNAQQGARLLVTAVLARVAALPASTRPQVHVVGESLGATAGQSALSGVDAKTVRSQVCSAMWVGTPGGHRLGMAHEVSVANPDDPVVHTRPRSLILPPSDGAAWLPVVSMVHSGVDLVGSLSVPLGSGHRYGPDQAYRLPTCG